MKLGLKNKQSFDFEKFHITSSRVTLRSISQNDIDTIFKEFTESIAKYMHPSPPQARSDTEHFISMSLEKMRSGQEICAVIELNSSKEFLGCCGIHTNSSPNTPELGVWIKKSAHGKKYGREAVMKLKTWADEMLEYEYLIYPVSKENSASRKIAEALGGSVFKEQEVSKKTGEKLFQVVYKIPTAQE
jgi:[ribosomal protein S5]-alanine N-acetyltransferase